MPTLSEIHINSALSSLSILPINPDAAWVNNRCAAMVNVDKASGKYFQYGREVGGAKSPAGSLARNIRSLRTPNTRAAEVNYSLANNDYFCSEYSLADFVADSEIRDSDAPLQPLLDAAISLEDNITADVEQVFAKIALDGANYNAANKVTLTTGASGTNWKTYTSANSDPLGVIKTARDRLELILQRKPNLMMITAPGARALAEHPQLKDIFKYTESGMQLLANDGLPPALRGLEIIVAAAVANSAAEGAAYSGNYVCFDNNGKDCALIGYKPSATAGKRTVASFLKFVAPDATTKQRGMARRAYRDETRKGWVVEVSCTCDFRFPFVDGSNLNTGAYLVQDLLA